MGDIFAIEQGTKVKCAVTGFKGVVTARLEYDTDCRQYLITPKALKNKKQDNQWIDESHLIDSVPKPKEAKKATGGYHEPPPARSHP